MERFSNDATAAERPSPGNLPAFLPYACAQLLAPFALRVLVVQQDEYVSKIGSDSKKKSKSRLVIQPGSHESPERTETSAADADDDDGRPVVTLSAVYDSAGHLVEIAFRRAPVVPRLLLKIIGMCAPFHPLLQRLSVRHAALGGDTLPELARLLPGCALTDLCLDDSPAPPRDYAALLHAPRLRCLSLARCCLDDAACAELAALLEHPRPAAGALALLSLPGNRIGDAGARALAHALRSNRSLHYLNLAGNRLTDDGAAALLDSLTRFPLTWDEVVARRRWLFEHLRLKAELFQRCYGELAAAEQEDARATRRRTTLAPAALSASGRGRRSAGGAGAAGGASTPDAAGAGGDSLAARAQALAAEMAGALAAPFGPEETVEVGGRTHCVGNTTLCALNLAYNELGYWSVTRLLRALRGQAARARRAGPGLLRVVLEGNALPACAELAGAQELLDHAVAARGAKAQRKADRGSIRAKSK